MELLTSGTRICANCHNSLENRQTISKINIANDYPYFVDEVHVSYAIAYIYGLSPEVFKGIVSEFSKHTTNSEEDEYSEDGRVFLCESCVPLLSENYKCHKLFENTIHPLSLVEQVKKYRSIQEVPLPFHKEMDNLVEDFNFDNDKEQDLDFHSTEIDEKFEMFAVSNEEESKLIEESPQVRRSPRMKELVIKLEKLSPDDLVQQNSTNQKRQRTSKSRKRKSKCKFTGTAKGESKYYKLLGRFRCNLCSKRFLTHDLRFSHEKICITTALKETPNRVSENMKTNVIGKHKPGQYKCDVCGKGFSNRPSRRRHRQRHFPETLAVDCPVCGKKLLGASTLRGHMKRAHVFSEEEKRNQKVSCEICAKLMDPEYMNKHMNRQHSSREPFKFTCGECSKEYLSKIAYDHHLRTHSKDFTPYLCGTCGKMFTSKENFYRHQKIHGEKKFECKICSKRFVTNNRLTTHQVTHSEERKFACELCERSYKTQTKLRSHLKIHKEVAEKGEHSFNCDVCGKLFRHSVGVRRHKSRCHKPADDSQQIEKPVYKCSFCEKILTTGVKLRAHEDRHRSNPLWWPDFRTFNVERT